MQRIKKELHMLFLRATILKDLFGFLFTHKLWWATPLILLSVILIIIFLFGQTTGVGPFIYPFF